MLAWLGSAHQERCHLLRVCRKKLKKEKWVGGRNYMCEEECRREKIGKKENWKILGCGWSFLASSWGESETIFSNECN